MRRHLLALALVAIALQPRDVGAQTVGASVESTMQRLEADAGVPPLSPEAGEPVAELLWYPSVGGEGLIIRLTREGDVMLAQYWQFNVRWENREGVLEVQNVAPSPRVTTLTARQFDTLVAEANALINDPPVISPDQPPCFHPYAVRLRVGDPNGLRSVYPFGCGEARTQRFVDRMRVAVGRMSPAAFSDEYGPG